MHLRPIPSDRCFPNVVVLPSPGPESLASPLDRRPVASDANALTLGLLLWVAYGGLRGDWVIIAANLLGATLSGIVLGCKIRDLR